MYLICSHNGIKEKGLEPVNVDKYPAIKRHLDRFKYEIEKRQDQGDTPYNLRNCAYWDDFNKQKIIFQEMVQEPSFILDNSGIFMCLDTARIITGGDLEILLSVLNSKLFFFAIKHFYGGGGLGQTGVRMKHTFFENYPMPTFSKIEKDKIHKTIQEPTINNYNAIDELLYSYYKLDEIEIGVIESI